MADSITLFLCGDVMLGRGIDQILPHPSAPVLHEPYARGATVGGGRAIVAADGGGWPPGLPPMRGGAATRL